MKDIIFLKKTRKKEKVSENIADTTTPVEMVQTTCFIDFALKYK